MDHHEAEHSIANGKGRHKGRDQVGPAQWLAAASGVSERTIWGITSGEREHIGLSKADALLMAVELPHFLQDGTIDVIPNPRLSQERWAEYMQERGCY